MKRTSLALAFGVAAGAVVADQATKYWAVHSLRGQPSMEVLGEWLQWTYATNSGAAFSLGSGNTWLFTIIATAVAIAVAFFVTRTTNRWWALALGLILGGAVGNLIDRFLRPPSFGQGHVVDFIDVPNWPIFNVADMCVVAGAGLLITLSMLGVEYRDEQSSEAEQEPVSN